jgi:hypothetical protein
MRALMLLATLIAAPAAAQFAPTPRVPRPSAPPPFIGSVGPAAPSSWRDTAETRERIRDGRDAGQLSRREARRLRHRSGAVDHVADFYAQDGVSASEARELQVRNQVLRDQVTATRSGVKLDRKFP